MVALFKVSYEIITSESAEYGELAEYGFICEGCSLRDALELVRETRTNDCDGILGIEANDSRIDQARWITIHNGMEFSTGCYENRSIHFPKHLTPSTRRRIARILGAYGA